MHESSSAPGEQPDLQQQLEKKVEPLTPGLAAKEERRMRLQELLEPTIIKDPIAEREDLTAAYALLQRQFRPEELEDLSVFVREMQSNAVPGSLTRYIMAIRKLRQMVIGMVYASAQVTPSEGITAIRFTVIDREHRGAFINRAPEGMLLGEARKFCESKGKALTVIVAEAVDASESYANKIRIEPGNGMRRLYYPDTTDEMHYELPPLAWNRDGTLAKEGMMEHLQIAIAECEEAIPVARLTDILRCWWAQWYIRPQEDFDSVDAWFTHTQWVWRVLDEKILVPLQQCTFLEPLSAGQRKKRETDLYLGENI